MTVWASFELINRILMTVLHNSFCTRTRTHTHTHTHTHTRTCTCTCAHTHTRVHRVVVLLPANLLRQGLRIKKVWTTSGCQMVQYLTPVRLHTAPCSEMVLLCLPSLPPSPPLYLFREEPATVTTAKKRNQEIVVPLETIILAYGVELLFYI